MTTYDNEGRGVLFKNEKGKARNAKAPDYTGKIEIDGVERDLAAWIVESGPNSQTPGRKFMSIRLGDPIGGQTQQAPPQRQAPPQQRQAPPPQRGPAPPAPRAPVGAPNERDFQPEFEDDDIPF